MTKKKITANKISIIVSLIIIFIMTTMSFLESSINYIDILFNPFIIILFFVIYSIIYGISKLIFKLK